MSGFFYYVGLTFDSLLSVFGVRATYEQPKYDIVGHLNGGVELRHYPALVAVETPIVRDNQGEAFGRLFRYISGANAGAGKLAMTVPVQMGPPVHMAMTVPVRTGNDEVMRFFLPRAVVERGPPAPTEKQVRIVTVPAETLAVLRFSGKLDDSLRATEEKALLAAVAGGGRSVAGPPSVLSYDPPFALPFVRRNEVAVPVGEQPQE